MTKSPIPTFQFSPKRLADIPFEIVRFEELPAIATRPSPRRRTFYEIFWINEGSGSHHIDFEAWEITKNSLHFITPRQVTFWDVERQVSGYALLFTPDFFATNLLEQVTLQSFDFFHHSTRKPIIEITGTVVNRFNTLCEEMVSEYTSEHYGRFTLLQCQLTTLLIHIQRHYTHMNPITHKSSSDKFIDDFRQLIEEHFQEVKNIQDYARMLNVTAGHLRDVTRDKLGVTPSYLLNQRIILEIKRLLTHSETTIAEIAQQLQYDDPSYFSRFFKREAGISPTAFRQHIREKYQHSHD